MAIAIARASQDQPPNKGPGSGPGQDRPSHLALPCLAYLASHRPRSPCLHLATTARPPSAAGRRGAPLLLLLVQARRARPMRGEVSQASQGLVSTPIHTTTNYDELRRPTTNYAKPFRGESCGKDLSSEQNRHGHLVRLHRNIVYLTQSSSFSLLLRVLIITVESIYHANLQEPHKGIAL